MAPSTQFRPGDMFGRYRLDRFLGAGGFAVVWQAYDTLTSTVVALKIFSSLDTQSIRQLAAEYAGVHNLSHPSIVRAEYFDSLDNVPFLVMKYCSGGNLEHREGRIGESDVLTMMGQIADALTYVHAQGLVHQDIKPANILCEQTPSGMRYMLSDFGISAKSRTRLSKSLGTGAQTGSYLTFAYAPPEKFSPRREDRLPNAKGDIFSLGITAYELAAGFLPFDDIPTGQQLHSNPALWLDYSAIHDPRLRTLIARCLAPDPAARPDAATLAGWVGHGITPPKPQLTPVQPSAPTQYAGTFHPASATRHATRMAPPPQKNRQPAPVRISKPKSHNRTGLLILFTLLGLLIIGTLTVFLVNHNRKHAYSVPVADSEYIEEVYNADDAGEAEAEVDAAVDSMSVQAAEPDYPETYKEENTEESTRFSDRYSVIHNDAAAVDSAATDAGGPK